MASSPLISASAPHSEAPRDLSGQIIGQRYRVERPLGTGGMGSVWEVQHVESLQRFALKCLHPTLAAETRVLTRFLREARAAGALRSSHVVRLIDAQIGYVHDGQPLPFLVMELLEGATVEHLVAAQGTLRPGHVCWVLRQVGRALQAAHQKGIVHRDLKPANVFVAIGEEGEPIVKLCDFGIAKLAKDSTTGLATASSANMVLGTPMYMAPEQLRGADQTTPSTDQWALAMLAFKALTGREYFAGAASAAELVVAILSDPLPKPSTLCGGLPRGFDGWFLRSCNRDAQARWPDTVTQVAALEQALGQPAPEPLSPNAPCSEQDAVSRLVRVQAQSSPAAHAQSLAPTKSLRFRDALVVGGCTITILAAMYFLRSRYGASVVEPMASLAGWASSNHAKPTPSGSEPASTSISPPKEAHSPDSPSSGSPAFLPPSTETVAASPPPLSTPVVAAASRRPEGSAHRAPATKTGPKAVGAGVNEKLGSGKPCERSSQCASGLCAAEVCQ